MIVKLNIWFFPFMLNKFRSIKYGKDFIKARPESNYDLPLSKTSTIPMCIIIVKSVFQEENNYYLQVLLYECLVCISMRISFSNPILLFTSCLKFHFCSEIFFFK